VVVLVAPAPPETVTDAAIIARLEPLTARMSLSDAARLVADELGVPKARAYDLGLALRRRNEG
jgi:16S rRNA (cytidine1402-2'-O)-methyltransferase